MSNATTVISTSQMKLAHAVLVLKQWQEAEHAAGRQTHGRCLESVRFALSHVGLSLPPPQPKPDNVALWCGHALIAAPDHYHWERVAPPKLPLITLDFFGACGRLPDGRMAGHIGLTNHETREIWSSANYVLDRYFLQRRFASFVPAP